MSIMNAECPKCKKVQAHGAAGVQKDEDGKKYQTLVCNECGTSTKIYLGKDGEDFQPNYEYPDDTDLTDIE